MLDAAILLVGLAQPRRSIASIAIRGGKWTCAIGDQPTINRDATRLYQAAHVDLAAAVLTVLLSSHLDSPRSAGAANASAREKKREFEHHDI